MTGVRDRLGRLCDQLTRHGTMAAEIDAAGAGPQLTALLGLLSTSGTSDDRNLPARLEDLLDAIEEACALHGLATLDVRGPADARPGDGRLPPGFGSAAEGAVDAWVCPWSRCGRVVFPEEATTAPPACAVGGTSLHAFPPR